MPTYWWDLNKTSFTPKLAPGPPSRQTGMDLTTLLTADHDYLWTVFQSPLVHLLRNGSMFYDKRGTSRVDHRSASGKIFLQPMVRYRTGFGTPPVTYEKMLKDMRDVFSDTANFIFQDQSVPFVNRPDQGGW